MDNILQTTKFVIDNSNFVKIDQDRIIDFSNSLELGEDIHWLDAAPFDFSHFNDEKKLNYLFLFNALSFSYWGEPKWTVEHNNKCYDGAWGLIVALGRGMHQDTPLLDLEMSVVNGKEDFLQILKANTEIPLLNERWTILQEVKDVVTHRFNGKLSNLIVEANNDTQRLLQLVWNNFPSFRDSSDYKGKEILFCKRAQLLIADIYQVFEGRHFGDLKNVDRLTACADYKLPQILRKLGILRYQTALAERIDKKIEIPRSSEEEVEIRANTIWAVELIKNEVQKRRSRTLAIEVNDWLWLATQKKFSDDKPYHRTRTTAY